jgi:hypothetical protein
MNQPDLEWIEGLLSWPTRMAGAASILTLAQELKRMWVLDAEAALELDRLATAAAPLPLALSWMRLSRRDPRAFPELEEDAQDLLIRVERAARARQPQLITSLQDALDASSSWLPRAQAQLTNELWTGAWDDTLAEAALDRYDELERQVMYAAALDELGAPLTPRAALDLANHLDWACEHPEALLPAHRMIHATTHIISLEPPHPQLDSLLPLYINFQHAWIAHTTIEGLARAVA